jgi:hypothetical protein
MALALTVVLITYPALAADVRFVLCSSGINVFGYPFAINDAVDVRTGERHRGMHSQFDLLSRAELHHFQQLSGFADRFRGSVVFVGTIEAGEASERRTVSIKRVDGLATPSQAALCNRSR